MSTNPMSAAIAKARALNPGQPQARPGFGPLAGGPMKPGPMNTGPFPPQGAPMNTGPFPPGGISTMPMPAPTPVPAPQMPDFAAGPATGGAMPMQTGAAGAPPGNTGIVPPHMRQPMGPMDATNMGMPMNRARFMNRKPNRGALMNILRQKMGGGAGLGMRVPDGLNPTMPAPTPAPLS